MDLAINETGNRYKKLVVVERVKNNKNSSAAWLCKCDCGEEKTVQGNALRANLVKSCGCMYRFPKGVAAFRNVISGMKSAMKRHRLPFDLTEAQVKRLHEQPCSYCGALPANISCRKTTHSTNGEYVYNGIDRINSKKGYVIDNVVSCCAICNRAKMDIAAVDFKAWIKQLTNFNKENK